MLIYINDRILMTSINCGAGGFLSISVACISHCCTNDKSELFKKNLLNVLYKNVSTSITQKIILMIFCIVCYVI